MIIELMDIESLIDCLDRDENYVKMKQKEMKATGAIGVTLCPGGVAEHFRIVREIVCRYRDLENSALGQKFSTMAR